MKIEKKDYHKNNKNTVIVHYRIHRYCFLFLNLNEKINEKCVFLFNLTQKKINKIKKIKKIKKLSFKTI